MLVNSLSHPEANLISDEATEGNEKPSTGLMLAIENFDDKEVLALGVIQIAGRPTNSKTRIGLDAIPNLLAFRIGGENSPWERFIEEKEAHGWTIVHQDEASQRMIEVFGCAADEEEEFEIESDLDSEAS